MRATILNNDCIWVNPCNNESHINPEITENFEQVNFDGVNHITVKKEGGKLYIIAASGFSPDRGMFRESYNH